MERKIQMNNPPPVSLWDRFPVCHYCEQPTAAFTTRVNEKDLSPVCSLCMVRLLSLGGLTHMVDYPVI